MLPSDSNNSSRAFSISAWDAAKAGPEQWIYERFYHGLRLAGGPADDLPDPYWEALLADASAEDPGKPIEVRNLSEIGHHVLRLSCRRCARIVEIQKADATRLYGARALWKDVGQRLLDNTCQQRTGRHEEDGCWPAFE